MNWSSNHRKQNKTLTALSQIQMMKRLSCMRHLAKPPSAVAFMGADSEGWSLIPEVTMATGLHFHS